MELDDTLKIQINKYLTGELSEADVTNFEVLLQKDEALRQQVELYKDLDDTLSATATSEKDFDKIEGLLNNLGDEFIVGEPKKEETPIVPITETKSLKNIIRYLIPFTAAAAALLLFTTFFSGDVDPKKLANANYQIYDVSFTTKSEATDLSQAEQLYNNEKWAVARDLFIKYPNNIKAQMAKANCEYQLQKYDDAIKTFTPIVKNKTDYSESAAWYLALTHLQKEDKVAAIAALNKITNDNRFYKKAQKLLRDLE